MLTSSHIFCGFPSRNGHWRSDFSLPCFNALRGEEREGEPLDRRPKTRLKLTDTACDDHSRYIVHIWSRPLLVSVAHSDGYRAYQGKEWLKQFFGHLGQFFAHLFAYLMIFHSFRQQWLLHVLFWKRIGLNYRNHALFFNWECPKSEKWARASVWVYRMIHY